MRIAATNLKDVLEAMSDEPESATFLLAEVAGRAIGLCEAVYLYCPQGRRLINEILGTELIIGTAHVGEVATAPEDDSPLNWDDPHSRRAA